MAGKNADYWKNRFEILEKSQHNRGMECYAELESQYRKAEKEIEGQISAWYQRFADNNEISLTEARRMLNSKELAEFKWDVNDYIKYGEENAMNGQWTKQLENASARYHVSRLESLEVQMQQQVEALFGNQLDSIDTAMKDIYTEGYYHTAFEIQKGVGVGWDFSTLDTKTIDKVINKPWAADGKNFSERVWDNREKLVNELNQTLVQNIILGQDPQKAIDAIADKLNVSKRSAGRLVMTEEAYFSSEAQKDCFRELDVEQYEIVATLDSHTSEICQEMDGKVFPMSQWEVGTTAPPFHPWCRSTTVPAFGDEFDNIGTRAARDEETGKTYQVPGNCTYDKWEKAFVEGDKSVLQEIPKEGTIKRNYDCDLAQKLGKENYDKMHDLIDDCDDENLKQLWEKYEDKVVVADAHHTGGAYASGSSIYVNIDSAAKGSSYQTPYEVIFHETSHAIDYLAQTDPKYMWTHYVSATYKDGAYLKSLKSEVEAMVNKQASIIKQDFKNHAGDWAYLKNQGYISNWNYEFYEKYNYWVGGEPKYSKSLAYGAVQKEINEIDLISRGNVSDIFGGATKNRIQCGVGHNDSYWKNDPDNVAIEAFAEMSDATFSNSGSLETIKKYLPESYSLWQEMIDVMLKEGG